jgi:hypothetical protein
MKTPLYILVAVLFLGAACGPLGGDEKPRVEILSPPDQLSLRVGDTLQIESRAEDDRTLGKVTLYVNGYLEDEADTPDNAKTFRAVQSWQPLTAGQYKIAVVAYDSRGQASDPATISVSVQAATPAVVSVTPTPAPTNAPPNETQVAPTVQPSPTPVPCTYHASFVADVTIPDNTQLAPGTEFVKTWRLRNSGTCNWGQGFRFVFVEGQRMNAPDAVAVPPTAVGATVDVSILFKAPPNPGAYRSRWRMRTADGQDFGDRPFVLIQVPAPTPTPGPGAIEFSITVAKASFNEARETWTDETMGQCSLLKVEEDGESFVFKVFCP